MQRISHLTEWAIRSSFVKAIFHLYSSSECCIKSRVQINNRRSQMLKVTNMQSLSKSPLRCCFLWRRLPTKPTCRRDFTDRPQLAHQHAQARNTTLSTATEPTRGGGGGLKEGYSGGLLLEAIFTYNGFTTQPMLSSVGDIVGGVLRMLNPKRHHWTPPKWLGSSAESPSDSNLATIWRFSLRTSGSRTSMRNGPMTRLGVRIFGRAA